MEKLRVMVAGCFDLLHASHIVFLRKAAELGELHVSLGSDQSILQQKNKSPAYSEAERKFMLENLRCVHWVGIVTDPGSMGFREHLDQMRPHIFVINEDGDTPEKRQLCTQFGVEYRVFPRDHFDPKRPTSTTEIACGEYIPTRIDLCSGFMDNPVVNGGTSSGFGHLVVLPIEPIPGLRERSGMATSTIRTIRKYFGCSLPTKYSVDQLAEIIFCLENPPHKRSYISGTLDSRGILGRGVNLFRYQASRFFPIEIRTIDDEPTLSWVERHLYLKHAWERPDDCIVKVRHDHPEFDQHCNLLNSASLECWAAIQEHDLNALASAVQKSFRSQKSVVDNHCPQPLRDFIAAEQAMAAMVMGAGGGGYVLFVAKSIPNDAIRFRIKRSDL